MPTPHARSSRAVNHAVSQVPHPPAPSAPPEATDPKPEATGSESADTGLDRLHAGQGQPLSTPGGVPLDRRSFLSLGVLGLAATTVIGRAGRAFETPLHLRANAAVSLVPARRAEDLCESYCVNTKIFYRGSVYSHTDAVIDLLKDLGTRVVRERLASGRSTGARQQQYALPRLSDAGVRLHGTVGEIDDWEQATVINKQVMDFVSSFYGQRLGIDPSRVMHSFGGCNEIDGPVLNGRNDPNWAAHARIMQKALWTEAKGNPLTQDVPVAGPSTRTDVTASRAAELGDLSAWCDRFGNAHMYNHGASPTRDIDDHLDILRPCFPDANRWIFTETGYNNSPQDNTGRTVPEAASATYAIRGICDFFKRGAIYGRFELLDDPDDIDTSSQARINATADREAHFGLVAMTKSTLSTATPDTWRKKPEFYSTQRFLSLMSDRGGSAFSPVGLQMSVTGGGADLQQLLVQKRDGRHYVLLWRDVDVSTAYPDGRPIQVRPVNVTVGLARSRPVAVYEPGTGPRPVASWSGTDSVTIPLAGELKVVELG